MAFLNIAGGVILILIGMRYLRKGLDRLFGNQLLDWLQRTTANRWKAFSAGIVAGTMAPSSTSIALLSVQMLSRAALPAGRMLAVVLGANVGITVTVQLLSFRLENFAAPLLLAGGIAFLYLRRELFRGIGQVLLAFGFIFLAMQLIGTSARAMASSNDLAVLFKLADQSSLAVLAGTAMLTVAMQSSTASIALGIGLAESGLISHAVIIPWVLGTNLGIAVTALLAGWTSVEGRRLGVGTLMVKGAGAIIFLIFIPQVQVWMGSHFPATINRQAADLHTGFNLILGLIALPFLGPLARLMNFLVEAPAEGGDEHDSYLDPLLLQSPTLALNQSAREEFRMMDELKLMLRAVHSLQTGKDLRAREIVGRHHSHLKSIDERLKSYLGQISDENLSADDRRWKFMLLDYTGELEAVGLLINRDLLESVLRQAKNGVQMPAGEREDIDALIKRTLGRMERATSIVITQNVAQAEAFIAEKEQFSHWCRIAQRTHHETAVARGEPQRETSPDYVDQLNCLRRINSHLTSAAYAVARPNQSAPEDGNQGSTKGQT